MEYEYSITVTYDRAPTPTWSARYDNELEAVTEFKTASDPDTTTFFQFGIAIL